jgi:hypothetical protein
MEWYRNALDNIKNLDKPPEKGFWGRLFSWKMAVTEIKKSK